MTFKPIVGKFVDIAGFKAHIEGLPFLGWRPDFVVVHNTSEPSLATYAEWRAHPERHGNWTPEQWGRNLAGYYGGMGWSSGPHAFVCPDGILLFSPFTAPGTHSPSWNTRTWGIETVGEFEREPFDDGSRDNLIAALGILHAGMGLNPADYHFGVRGLHFHKEDPKTTHRECPGKNMVKENLVAAVVAYIANAHPGDHATIPADAHTAPAVSPATPAAPVQAASAAADDAIRHSMAKHIIDFEARRDANGHFMVYKLPANDGGGSYEVAGINEKYDPVQAAHLKQLVEAQKFDEAETYAQDYILQNTDAAMAWTQNAAIEFYLRDCVFNRGAHGAARILQRACGVSDDGDIGPESRKAIATFTAPELLTKLREAREDYERHVVGVRENLWRGLVNRWDKSLVVARSYLA